MAREKRRKTAAEANLSPLFGLPLNDWNPLFGNTDPEATVQQEGDGSSSSTDVVPPQPGSSSSSSSSSSAGAIYGLSVAPVNWIQTVANLADGNSGRQEHPEEEPEPAPPSTFPRRQ